MNTYKLSYDWQDLATVEIDEEKALCHMREMILFWTCGEDRLDDNDGDVVKTWLKQLAGFIIDRGRKPDGDEGWVKLDGTYGIKVTKTSRWVFDEDSVLIKKV